MKRLLLSLSFLLMALFSPGCLGPSASQASDAAMFASMQASWDAMQVEYDRGIDVWVGSGSVTPPAEAELRGMGAEMSVAIASRDWLTLRAVNWAKMKPYVHNGIDDMLANGEVGPGVAGVLRERVHNFEQVYRRVTGYDGKNPSRAAGL